MQMNPSVTIERKRVDCSVLPKGWQRDEGRKSGSSSSSTSATTTTTTSGSNNNNNKVDVFYYSQTGKRVEGKQQQGGEVFDIGSFDFQSGKLQQRQLPSPSISLYRCSAMPLPIGAGGAGAGASLKRKYARAQANSSVGGTTAASTPSTATAAAAAAAQPTTAGSSSSTAGGGTSSNLRQQQQMELSRALRTDVSLVPPIRQTASIFKQPVTAIGNHSQDPSKVKHDAKHGAQEKPKQLFWEKRLERLRACHDNGEELDDISLPKTIRTVGPNVNEQTVLQSVATALHMLNAGVHGQSSTKAELTKNAMAFMNPEQPLMHAVIISEEDIRKQEDRVGVARRKLQDALKT
ncbi:methyl-CpG-binding domain protein 2 isoform X1 [Drosophila guanche]|uniref:Blast:Methyl-CpG-binding domain protein 2 n=1 Tax=Drosophila guanche TaxID=7266 RepID=A0A3B0JNR8_DROGU|nr:methyl-CpG-binding domain protein 2 isoform X1 [Drosophila guanche]SPP83884.1 blast:Methyl-CpG-binding domain protein 2 [Drosophila guanche]